MDRGALWCHWLRPYSRYCEGDYGFQLSTSTVTYLCFCYFCAAKDIYNVSIPANTWGGPIIQDGKTAGKYHAYVPKYAAGALFGAKHVLHGTGDYGFQLNNS
jgi:hypothetical protein